MVEIFINRLVQKINMLNLFLVNNVVVEQDEDIPTIIIIKVYLSKWGYFFFGLIQWFVKRKLAAVALDLPEDFQVTIEATYQSPKK